MEKGRESGTSSAAYPTSSIRSKIRKEIVMQETLSHLSGA